MLEIQTLAEEGILPQEATTLLTEDIRDLTTTATLSQQIPTEETQQLLLDQHQETIPVTEAQDQTATLAERKATHLEDLPTPELQEAEAIHQTEEIHPLLEEILQVAVEALDQEGNF